MIDLIITIAPVFIIIAVGIFAKYVKLANDTWIEILNKFALYVAFPALIFSSLAGLGSRTAINYPLFFYNSLFLIAALAIIYVIMRLLKVKKELRNCYLLCATFGNTAYLGFPYITSIIPESGGDVSIVIASHLILLFTVGLWILEASLYKKAGIMKIITDIIKNPLLIAVIFGVLFVQLNIQLPVFLDKSIKMLGAGASPVVLFALGIFLLKKIQLNKKLMHSIIITGIKLLVFPAAFILISMHFIKDPTFTIATLESAMPGALTFFALSQLYPMDKTVVVYMIIISTILSVITLPILTLLVL